jgi:hypothetical protein
VKNRGSGAFVNRGNRLETMADAALAAAGFLLDRKLVLVERGGVTGSHGDAFQVVVTMDELPMNEQNLTKNFNQLFRKCMKKELVSGLSNKCEKRENRVVSEHTHTNTHTHTHTHTRTVGHSEVLYSLLRAIAPQEPDRLGR